ncbi:hypothetical protein MJH54_29550, partial [Salmonella enterica subsp. enterica serovar Montevideo]|nr:hypothetical protein [Salmonella enterica subsp. enterica serovar Montevideo]
MDSARNQVLFALNDYLAGMALDQLSNQAAVGGISFSTNDVARNPVCCYPYSPTYCIYRELYMTGRQDIVVSDDQIQVVVNR